MSETTVHLLCSLFCLTTLPVAQNIVSDGRMNWKEAAVPSRQLPGGTEENHKTTSTENWNKLLPNKNQIIYLFKLMTALQFTRFVRKEPKNALSSIKITIYYIKFNSIFNCAGVGSS